MTAEGRPRTTADQQEAWEPIQTGARAGILEDATEGKPGTNRVTDLSAFTEGFPMFSEVFGNKLTIDP